MRICSIFRQRITENKLKVRFEMDCTSFFYIEIFVDYFLNMCYNTIDSYNHNNK